MTVTGIKVSSDAARIPADNAGSSKKRRRDHGELEAQARTFGTDWRVGDRVITWLHRHEGQLNELSHLVKDGWSWADIGRAMHIAGIAYRTGAPITDVILRKKATEARSANNAKSARSQEAAGPLMGDGETPPARQQAPVRSPSVRTLPPPTPTQLAIEDEEPEFKPASFIKYPPREPPKAPPPLTPVIASPALPAEIDVAAVIARFIRGR
jgi:hypothetical protein